MVESELIDVLTTYLGSFCLKMNTNVAINTIIPPTTLTSYTTDIYLLFTILLLSKECIHMYRGNKLISNSKFIRVTLFIKYTFKLDSEKMIQFDVTFLE